MKWEDVKIGQLVRLIGGTKKRHTDYIGYIYKIDKEDKMVKVEWSISMCDWEYPQYLESIYLYDDNLHFFTGLLETVKNEILLGKHKI